MFLHQDMIVLNDGNICRLTQSSSISSESFPDPVLYYENKYTLPISIRVRKIQSFQWYAREFKQTGKLSDRKSGKLPFRDIKISWR